MPDFSPSPNDTVTIGGETYRVKSHPAIPAFPYAQEGRKATVYQLAASNEYLYALKVFKGRYRVDDLVDITHALMPLATWDGMMAAQRTIIMPGAHDSLIDQYSNLEYAALMPWIFGSTWYDMVIGMRVLKRAESIKLAHSLADLLAALEEAGIAHCDIAAPNVIINLHAGSAHLIDLEDMYFPNLQPPEALPAGTEGYAHATASDGLWQPLADRFAGAVLIAEIVAWHNADIRKLADEEHYFEATEMQIDSPRYQLISRVMADLNPKLAELFEQAWYSDTLEDCPPLRAYHEVLSELHHTEQVAGVVSDWKPLTLPGIKPAEEGAQAKEAQPDTETTAQTAPVDVPPAPPADQDDTTEDEQPAQPSALPNESDVQPAPSQASRSSIQLPTFDPAQTSRPITPPPSSAKPTGQSSPSGSVSHSLSPGRDSDPVVGWRPLDMNGGSSTPAPPPTTDRRPIQMPEPEPQPDPMQIEEEEEEPAPIVQPEIDAVPEPEESPVQEMVNLNIVPDEEDTAPAPDDAYDEDLLDPELADSDDVYEALEDYPEEGEMPEDDTEPFLDDEDEYEEQPAFEPAPPVPRSGLLKPILDLAYMDERNRPHLVWSESPDADQYLLEEDEDPAFSDPKEYRIKSGDTRWSPGLFWRRSGRLYYRVRAENGNEVGPWSEVVRVRIGRG